MYNQNLSPSLQGSSEFLRSNFRENHVRPHKREKLLVFQWFFNGFPLVFPWFFNDFSMVLQWPGGFVAGGTAKKPPGRNSIPPAKQWI